MLQIQYYSSERIQTNQPLDIVYHNETRRYTTKLYNTYWDNNTDEMVEIFDNSYGYKTGEFYSSNDEYDECLFTPDFCPTDILDGFKFKFVD